MAKHYSYVVRRESKRNFCVWLSSNLTGSLVEPIQCFERKAQAASYAKRANRGDPNIYGKK